LATWMQPQLTKLVTEARTATSSGFMLVSVA
jgi:hypothetical protein